MHTLLGCIAIVLTIAFLFGKKAARIFVLAGLGIVAFAFLAAVGYVIYGNIREGQIQATMKRMPPGIPEQDRVKIETYLRDGTGLTEQDRK
jgi:uncharacterized membrane protein YebE (DUF533 family)